KSSHDLAQRGRMILRLEIVLDTLDAEYSEVVAEPRKRAFVEKTGQIVGGIGQQLASPKTDEQIEIFALDTGGHDLRCGLGQNGMGLTKRRCVAAQARDLRKQSVRRRTGKQRGKQRVFPRASGIDGIDIIIWHRWLAIEIGTKLLTRHASRGLDCDHPSGGHAVPV